MKSIFVATTRVIDPVTKWPGEKPGEILRRLSVPIIRPGKVFTGKGETSPKEMPRGPAVVYGGSKDFVAEIRKDASTRKTKEALLFIHGYNNTLDTSLTRATQMFQTFNVPTVPVHFAWASIGAPLAYIADRDTVLSARDALEETITDLSMAGLKVVILAHSMGAHLLMETLRQMAIGKSRYLNAIAGVFLIAPDVDVSLFKTQLRRIPKLPQPFVVMTNRKDRALGLARALTGRRERLGSIEDPATLADYKITIVDATALTNGGDHFPVGNSPALAGLLRDFSQVPQAFEDKASIQGLLAGTVVVGVRSITQVVLLPSGL